MMGYDVVGEGDTARYLITREGSRLTATYGNEHVDPDKWTDRYLDDAIGPARYARVHQPRDRPRSRPPPPPAIARATILSS